MNRYTDLKGHKLEGGESIETPYLTIRNTFNAPLYVEETYRGLLLKRKKKYLKIDRTKFLRERGENT